MTTLADTSKGEVYMGDTKCQLSQSELEDIEYVRAYIEGQNETIAELLAHKSLGERMLKGVRCISMSYTPKGTAVDMRLEFDVTINSDEPEFKIALDWTNEFSMRHKHIA